MKILLVLLLAGTAFGQLDLTTWQRVDHTDPSRNVVTANTIEAWGDHGPWGTFEMARDRVHLLSPEATDNSALASSSKPLTPSWIREFADNSERWDTDCLLLDNDWPPIDAQQATIVTIHDNGEEWLGAFKGDLKELTHVGWKPDGTREEYSVLALLQRVGGHINILATELVPPTPQGTRTALAVQFDGAAGWAYWYQDNLTYWVTMPPTAPLAADGYSGLIAMVGPKHLCQGGNETARRFTFIK